MRLLGICAVLFAALPLLGEELSLDFHDAQLDATPPGFRSSVSGTGTPGNWKVIIDEAPSLLLPLSAQTVHTGKRLVLAQLSRDPTDERYPLLIYDKEQLGDFKLTTKFKILDGEVEQMAGIAFRLQDEKNYYYIRASALGTNLSFFKWVDGQLIGPIGSKMVIPKGVWQELAIQCRANEILCQLNGKEAFPALHDNSFLNGKIAFWTKSDSLVYFADTRVSYTRKETLAQILVRDTIKANPRLVGLNIYLSNAKSPNPILIAGTGPKPIGAPGGNTEQEVLARGNPYYLKDARGVTVTLPLRDCNGEIVAAAEITMKSFPGQTEKNAVERASPIAKLLETKFMRASELTQ